jgi:transcription factor SPT20
MATAVASKPLPQAQKMKRPPPPYLQTSTNGIRAPNPVPSPSSASKRPSGSGTPFSANSQNGLYTNATGPRPNRQRKESQRMGEPTGRPQRLATRSGNTDSLQVERRSAKRYPEPYGKLLTPIALGRAVLTFLPPVPSESHILRKFKGHLPSLIVHLHPTHFRFDQQEGSFSYHSEMRMFIEHLQKRTIPHDMLEELRKSDVRFYDGWLIVRVVDHKSVAATAGGTSSTSSSDQFSIHNHNPYITPSPWRPYPTKNQSNADSDQKSPKLKQEPGDDSSIRPRSASGINGQNGLHEASPKSRQPQPKIFHVALRPTALSQHMDIVIDSMTPDPKALNRRQSQALPNARTPSSSMPPPTPLSAVPSTPSFERGPPAKKLKMKIESKDLLVYEGRIVNSTAPPLFLDAMDSLEDAQNLLEFLKDPWHDEPPPSPKGRKRTIAELAADDALAKEQERFMLIMDESNNGGAMAANATNADGPAAASLFQPRFEKFNALETIKSQHAENKRLEDERKAMQDHLRRTQQREEEARRIHLLEQQQQQQQRMEEARRRQQMVQVQISQRQQAMQAAAAAVGQQQQQQTGTNHINGVSGVPPNMQNHIMHASQGQRSSPIVRTSTPHMNSSPLIGQMSHPGQSVSMAPTSSNPGAAGSPPRPGSGMQHGHPGVAMARGQSAQGPSRNGTPQIPQGTPGMRHATPVVRQVTPTNRANNTSPHVGMVAQTPQISQSGMMNGGNAMPGMTPQQNAAMQAHRQALHQHHGQNFNQQLANGQAMTPEQAARLRAQNHALNQQRAMQHQMQQQQDGQHPHQYQPNPNSQNAFQQQTANYNAQVRKMTAEMLSNQHFQAQAAGAGSSPQNQTPHQQAAQMSHQTSQPGMPTQAQGQPQQQQQQQQQRPGQPLNSQQVQQYFTQRVRSVQNHFLQQLAVQNYGGNHQLIQPAQRDGLAQRAKNQVMQDMVQRGMINPPQRQGQMTQQQMLQMQQAQQAQQAQGQGQGGAGGGGIQNTPQNMAFMRQQMMQQQALQQQQQAQQQHQQQQQQIQGLPGAGVLPK